MVVEYPEHSPPAEVTLQNVGRSLPGRAGRLAQALDGELAPVRDALQVLMLLDETDPRARQAVEVIRRQLGHLARLAEDL